MPSKTKVYNICIGEERLIDVISGRTLRVSHIATPRWISFFKKQLKEVILYGNYTNKKVKVSIKSVEKIQSLGDTIIIININKLLPL